MLEIHRENASRSVFIFRLATRRARRGSSDSANGLCSCFIFYLKLLGACARERDRECMLGMAAVSLPMGIFFWWQVQFWEIFVCLPSLTVAHMLLCFVYIEVDARTPRRRVCGQCGHRVVKVVS